MEKHANWSKEYSRAIGACDHFIYDLHFFFVVTYGGLGLLPAAVDAHPDPVQRAGAVAGDEAELEPFARHENLARLVGVVLPFHAQDEAAALQVRRQLAVLQQHEHLVQEAAVVGAVVLPPPQRNFGAVLRLLDSCWIRWIKVVQQIRSADI